MATFLDDVRVDYNFTPVQIEGTGDATSANYITFDTPVEIRRVSAVTSIPVNSIIIWLDRDGSGDLEQLEILAMSLNCPGETYQSVVHACPFKLQLPQLNTTGKPQKGGKIYLETSGLGGGDSWSLTVEARG